MTKTIKDIAVHDEQLINVEAPKFKDIVLCGIVHIDKETKKDKVFEELMSLIDDDYIFIPSTVKVREIKTNKPAELMSTRVIRQSTQEDVFEVTSGDVYAFGELEDSEGQYGIPVPDSDDPDDPYVPTSFYYLNTIGMDAKDASNLIDLLFHAFSQQMEKGKDICAFSSTELTVVVVSLVTNFPEIREDALESARRWFPDEVAEAEAKANN